ncbi:MAG: type II toxin-antitoxin system VapC family toxin [Oscillochloridaceae bacterium umkhey_bin13]
MSEPFYADTSALIKRHLDERGSSWVRTRSVQAAGNTIFTSELITVEGISALTRRVREGILDQRRYLLLRDDLLALCETEYQIIPLTETIKQQAQRVLERHPLRALDALHLASALYLAEQLAAASQPRLIMLASDGRLLAAAHAEGLAVINPEQEVDPPEPTDGTPAADAPDEASP